MYPQSGEEIKTGSTSKGDQKKWYRDGLWIKQNRHGYEGLAEWFTYQLLRCSNVPESWYVPYEVCKLVLPDGRDFQGCYSNNFLAPGDLLLPVQRLLDSMGIEQAEIFGAMSVEQKVRNLVSLLDEEYRPPHVYQYFSFMLSLDAVILNEDRHLNNIALIKEKDGTYRMCPLFDHGLSLLSDEHDYPHRFDTMSNVVAVEAKPFDADFLKQMRAIKNTVPLEFSKKEVIGILEENKQELGRIYDVMQIQMDRCKHMFV